MTRSEDLLAAKVRRALEALAERRYERLEALLMQAALDARALRLLGPEGADGIPVSHVDDVTVGRRPGDLVQEVGINGRTYYVLTANGLDKLGRPDLAEKQRAAAAKALGYDSPAGAGDAVEADRG